MLKRLRWYDLITINFFWLGLNIRNNAIGTILMPYMVDRFVDPSIKNTALGEMRTAGLVIAMLIQPIAGLLSDRSLSRFGRRRPFIAVGVLLDLVFMTLIALSRNYWSMLAGILLQQFSANLSHGALQGLIPDLVPEDQRGRASGVKAIMELLPLIIVAFTISKLVGAGLLMWAFFATGAMLLLTMLVTIFSIKEIPLQARPAAPLAPTLLRVLGVLAGIAMGALAGFLAGGLVGGIFGLASRPFTSTATAWGIGLGIGGLLAMAVAVVAGVWAGALTTLGQEARRQSSFTWWMVNRLMYLAAITTIQGTAPYFLMFAFQVSREKAAAMTGNLMMVVGLSTILTALPSGWLADRFGGKRLVAVSGIVAAIGTFLLLGTIWRPNIVALYVIGVILGLATGLFTTTNWAVGTTLVPAQEAGRYLGISNLAGAGAGMIGAGIGGPITDRLNALRPGLGYFITFGYFAILFILSAVVLLKVRVKPPAGSG